MPYFTFGIKVKSLCFVDMKAVVFQADAETELIEIHKEDLMADWKLAVAGEPVFKIDPLK